ncbi:MAG: permease [Bacteroidetes bacterium]|nr:MAG: permease [Bacteroidota bacterium]
MNKKLITWLLFLALSLIWGSSFILMKQGMKILSPYQVAAIRMFTAGLVLLPVSLRVLKNIPREKLLMIFICGLIGSFFPAFFFCIAEVKIDSGLTAIINALTPLFTIVIGISFFNKPFVVKQFGGVILGLTGVCLLFLVENKIEWTYLGFAFFVILAAICYGLNVNLVGKFLKEISSTQIVAVAFLMLIIPSFLILFFTGYFSLNLTDGHVLLSTAAGSTLGILGTALATIIFYTLLKIGGPLFATLVTYVIPFIALVWGFLAGEKITIFQLVCLLLILCGVFLATGKVPIVRRKKLVEAASNALD